MKHEWDDEGNCIHDIVMTDGRTIKVVKPLIYDLWMSFHADMMFGRVSLHIETYIVYDLRATRIKQMYSEEVIFYGGSLCFFASCLEREQFQWRLVGLDIVRLFYNTIRSR